MNDGNNNIFQRKHKVDLSIVYWISCTMGNLKLFVLLLLFIQIVVALCGVSYAWLIRELINKATEGNKILFVRSALLLVLIIIFQLAMSAFSRHLEEYTRSSVENCFKQRLFCTLLKKDYRLVTITHSAEWINRLTSDTVVIADTMTQIIPGMAGMIVRLAGAVFLLIMLVPYLAFIIIPGGAVLIILTAVFRKRLKSLYKYIQETDGKLRIFFQEYLSNMIIIRVFNQNKYVEHSAETLMKQHQQARMKRNQFSNICNIGFGLAMYGFTVLGIIVGGYGILRGSMSYGSFAAIQQLISQIQGPIANITGYFPRYYAMLASAERLHEAEFYKNDLEKTEVPQWKIQEFYKKELQSFGLHTASFVYQSRVKQEISSTRVLNNIEFEVKKREYIALVGTIRLWEEYIIKSIDGILSITIRKMLYERKGRRKRFNC